MTTAEASADDARPWAPTTRDLIVLWMLAVVAAAAIGTHGLAYWDAGDYVRQAVRSQPSGLLLGRPFFLFVSRLVVEGALRCGAGADAIEPTLRWFWTCVSAIAPPMMAVLVARLGMGRAASLAAGAALAIAPSFAHTSHQVLTDAPALALSLIALVVALPPDFQVGIARAFLCGAILSFAVATRETAAVQVIALATILAARKRNLLVMLLAVSIGLGVLATMAKKSDTLTGWIAAMARSSERHPVGWIDLLLSLAWIVSLGPLPVALGAIELVKFGRRRWSDRLSRTSRPSLRPRDTLSDPTFAALRAVVVPSAVATGLLVLYPDGSFSPRYLLATGPIALFALAAPRLSAMLSSRARLPTAIALVAPLALAPFAARNPNALAARAEAVTHRLSVIPDHALVAPGHVCPAIGAKLAVDEAARARRTGNDLPPERFELLCPGWSWPGDLETLRMRLNRARCVGRTVVLDVSDDAWVGTREESAKRDVRGYVDDQPRKMVEGWTMLEPLPLEDARCE